MIDETIDDQMVLLVTTEASVEQLNEVLTGIKDEGFEFVSDDAYETDDQVGYVISKEE